MSAVALSPVATRAPVQVYETRNIAEGNRLYEIDPRQLIDLEFRLLPEQGQRSLPFTIPIPNPQHTLR